MKKKQRRNTARTRDKGKSSHGGSGRGQGRHPGSPNKSTKEVQDLVDKCTNLEEIFRAWAREATRKPLTQVGFQCGLKLVEYRFGKTPQGITIDPAGGTGRVTVEFTDAE